MNRDLRALALGALCGLAFALAACVHRYDLHCDLVDGLWTCTGGAEGNAVAM